MVQLKQPKPPAIPEDTTTYLSHFPGKHLFFTLPENSHRLGKIEHVWEMIHNKDAFLTVNEVKGNRRLLTEVAKLRAVWVDDDSPRKGPRTDFPLQPSIIVRTSNEKYHYYWLTETTNIDEWNQVMARMVLAHGCDKGAKDAARVLRLPGTKNYKYDPPQNCALVDATGDIYKWTTILENFPPVETVPKEAKTGISDFNMQQAEEDFLSATSIFPSMNGLILHWRYHYSLGKTRENVEGLFERVKPEVRKEHYKRYEYAYKQINKQLKTADKTVRDERQEEFNACLTTEGIHFRDIHPLGGIDVIPDPILSDYVPPVLWEASKACAKYLSVGQDPMILSGLSTICSLLSKNVIIEHISGGSLETYCTMGLVLVMETGTRKTEIYDIMNKPVQEFEKELIKKYEETQYINNSTAYILETSLKKLKKQYEKAKDPTDKENEQIAFKMAHLMQQIDALQLHPPSIFMKDITEEEIIRKMHENKGSIAITSDDARNILKNILGRYNRDSNTSEGIYIEGLTGKPSGIIKYNRVKDGGTRIEIHGPALNVFLFVQQDLALKLKQHDVYRTSGLAARMYMYFYPVDTIEVVKNSDRRRPQNTTKMQPYYEALRHICHRRMDRPLRVVMSEGALQRFNTYNQEYVKLLEKDRYAHQILNKAVTQSVIYATCLAAIDDPVFGRVMKSTSDDPYILSAKHANMGIGMMKHIARQTLNTYQILDDVGIVHTAQSFADSMLRKYKAGNYIDGFTRNSYLYQSFGMLDKDNYIKVVDYLVDKGWLGTSVSDKPLTLNKGRTKGAKAGETVYHLNVNGIKKIGRVIDFLGI